MRRGVATCSRAGVGYTTARRVVALALVLTAAGCTPEPAFDNDPLVGGRPLPRAGSTPAAPPPVAVASGPAAGPLQLPPPGGSVSPASLASGGAPAADASTLRLGPPPAPGTPGALTSTGGEAWHGTTTANGPTLMGPQPISDGAVKPIAVVGPPPPVPAPAPIPTPIPAPMPTPPPPSVQGFSPAPSAPAAPDTYAQLQDALAKKGVLYQQMTGPDDQGVWRFNCAVPRMDGVQGNHNIEVSAAGEGGLTAMRAAISQIDQYQRQGH